MLIDAFPFSSESEGNVEDLKTRALGSVVKLIEQKLGVSVVYNARNFRFERPDLRDAFEFAGRLEKHGVLKTLSKETLLPDEPRMYLWRAVCNEQTAHAAGGASIRGDRDSLYAALSECLERYIWFSQTDHFKSPMRATVAQMRLRSDALLPERFSGYTEEQRKASRGRTITEESEFLWTQATSLISGNPIYIPAQTISGAWGSYSPVGNLEPTIRQPNTIGLATWPTLSGARLAGALEVIEREAYMVMWLNQLSLPRIAPTALAAQYPMLKTLFDTCKRYRLQVHVVKMLTDAPTHAICVIMEDTSGNAPRFSFGLKAHRSLATAVEKAATEALRARTGERRFFATGNTFDPTTPTQDIGHRERMYYWAIPEHAKRLEFLLAGKETPIETAPWDQDSEDQQLVRIINWCKENNFACVSVPLSTSASNPTSLHVEMVVIPELQNTYLSEHMQAFGGTRWKEVPGKFQYTARKEPYADAPHPFS